ncbi:MAG: hypothetical protein H0T89_04080 [Deltaproteobacteria bacterium]|nr:hypothetical protein [Deltaproteobacteria bacterium]
MKRALASPWLGVLVIAVGGIIGFALSGTASPVVTLDDVTVTVRDKRDNGSPWDFGGGLPDPEVRIEQAGKLVARCAEVKDQLQSQCAVGARIERAAGDVRVIVVDGDSAEDDPVGELVIALPDRGRARQAGAGALQAIEVGVTDDASAFVRYRPLWIALAIALALAGILRFSSRSRRPG